MTTSTAPNRVTQRYGELTTLEELAAFFGVSLRVVRPLLRKSGITIIETGAGEFVQIAALEHGLGLMPVELLEEAAEVAAYRARTRGGRSPHQVVADVTERTEARLGTRLVDA
jgi:hypothetical protein